MNNRLHIVALVSAITFASSGRIVDAQTQASIETYFPKGTFSDLTFDTFLVDVFRKHLRQLGEPRLNVSLDDVFAIRCLWMSPYKGDELVRIESRHGQKPFAIYKRTEVDRDGKVSGRRARKIYVSGQAVSGLAEYIEQSGVMDLSNAQDVISSDGPIWMMELYSRGRYQAIYRTDPREGVFKQTCERLVKISNVPLDIQ